MTAENPPPQLSEIVRGPALAPFAETSIGAMIAERAKRLGNKEALRFRAPTTGKWQSLSYAQVNERRRTIAAGLLAQNLRKGDRVFLLSPNSAEMLLVELAILSIGAVSTPVYPEYPLEILRHCLRDSGARFAVAGSAAEQKKLAEISAGALERIVVLDSQPHSGDSRVISLTALERPFTTGERPFVTAENLIARSDPLPLEAREQALEDVDAICADLRLEARAFLLYTSGTTGRPKGVPLTHRNVLSQQAAIAQRWTLSPDDVFLAYLPWHHCFGALFERMMALWHGALLVLDDSRGRDLDKLLANFAEVQPTLYMSVPRVYLGLVARAEADPKARAILLHPKLRFVFTAAAPLPEGCYRFFETSNVPVHEGWGLTETSPDATLTGPGERKAGATGWPLPGTELLLEPVDEGNQEAGFGEILVRGPQVMSGYHGDVEATRRVLRADGFLRTGDLGVWTAHGLKIGGRVDGVFKLQNGEKVSSGEVEARLLAASTLLEQAMVLGPGQPFATALLWLNHAAALAFAEELGLLEKAAPGSQPTRLSLAELSALPEIRRALAEALQASNLLAAIPYERARRAALIHEPLSIDRGELTPTMKLVRSTVTERHAPLVDALRSESSHAQILELHRKGDAFQNA